MVWCQLTFMSCAIYILFIFYFLFVHWPDFYHPRSHLICFINIKLSLFNLCCIHVGTAIAMRKSWYLKNKLTHASARQECSESSLHMAIWYWETSCQTTLSGGSAFLLWTFHTFHMKDCTISKVILGLRTFTSSNDRKRKFNFSLWQEVVDVFRLVWFSCVFCTNYLLY